MSSITAKITTASEMRGFAGQYPRTAEVFGEIVGRWRGSRARRPGSQGYWAAYTHAEWCEQIGLKTSALKEHLDRLEAAGLIERQRGHHMGNRVVSFIRPTQTGLSLAKARSSDWQLLGIDAPTLDTAVEIEAVFAAAYEAKTGMPLKVLSKVEKKALKDIVKDLPTEGFAVVDRCVRSWGSFIAHVGDAIAMATAKLPTQPSAKFIRLHLQSACDFAAKQAKTPKKSEKPTLIPTLKSAGQVQLIAQTQAKEDTPQKMTKEEFLAILNSPDDEEEKEEPKLSKQDMMAFFNSPDEHK